MLGVILSMFSRGDLIVMDPYLVSEFNNYRNYNNYKYWQVRH